MAATKIQRIKGLFPLPLLENVPTAMYLAQLGGEGEVNDKKFIISSTCGTGGASLVIHYGDRQFVIDGIEVVQELVRRDQAGTLTIEEKKDVVRKRGRKSGS